MPKINLKVQNPKKQLEVATGFLGGLNTFQDQTVIRDSELTEAKNIILSVDGVEPRYGTDNYGDDASDAKVYGALGFYKSDGTRQFLRVSGNRIKKYDSGTWTAVDTDAFTAVNTDLLQARDKVYSFNGSDNLTYYDGSTVTVFTALTTPVGLGVTATGTTGSTAYSYRVSAFNAVGETLACVAVAIANGNATLSTTNYNALAWTATAGAVGYNVWGRKTTGFGESYIKTVYTNSYNDVGDYSDSNPTGATPSQTLMPPEGNTTAGVKGKFACFAISRLFVAGDTANPSRLYWGGVGTNLNNFSGDISGGGYVDVFKNDGAIIRGVIAFQGGVIVGKDNAIYKFSFTDDGSPRLEEITRSFGLISHRGIKHVENDIIFPAKKDGRLAFYSLGNQENYSAAVLRTNELSIKIASRLTDVNLSRLEYACAFYYRNVYGCAIATTGSTVNDRIWCLDTRFGAWVYWEDLNPNCFVVYTDTDGTENLYYGSDNTGYMVKMFQDDRNDNGSAISVEWTTKAFNQKLFNRYKHYYSPTFQFKAINKNSAIDGDIILDGAVTEKSFSVSTISTGGAGIGAMLVGGFLAGEASGGTPADVEASDQIVEIAVGKKELEARSIKYSFRTSTSDLQFKFLSLAHEYEVLEGKRLPQTSRVY